MTSCFGLPILTSPLNNLVEMERARTLTCDLVLEFEPPPGVLGVGAEGHADLLAQRVELVLRGQVRAARLHGLVEQCL